MLRHPTIFGLVLLSPFLLFAQGYPPELAAKKMTVADGLSVRLVAAEPLVRQPIALDFDDRGRLWVMQYLQYPNPAGLKRVKVDRFSRTVYDKVPQPPPHGPKGADRLTILHDFDAQGWARQAKNFLGDLNLGSGFAFGHGGVFVLQTPYLLFYPDRDCDDVSDGPPEVLVKGFGMEDAHAVANSLTWGPDGWLYGCQGSTVTANIQGHVFQQGVWRYHPIKKTFELFCDGGGNAWGLDFDRHGNLFYSTNFGGFTMCHGVQGGYYWKQFSKHGNFQNPYTFGYFDHVPHQSFKGGHVTVGGMIYQGDSFPKKYQGKYLAADLLGHAAYWHDVTPVGSSFRTAHGGDLLLANDTWFAPTDVTMGPDGSVYVADWHDPRTAHPDPDAQWDRSNGRIYKIEAQRTKPAAPFDLAKLPSDKLVSLLGQPNDWFRRRARVLLAERRDPKVHLPLRHQVLTGHDEDQQLQALWALYVSGGFNDALAEKLLDHANPQVRRWTVRFLGDEKKVTPGLAERLAKLAAGEGKVLVRSQLASSARRLPTAAALPIVWSLLERREDDKDPHLPLLLWWAVEEHALSGLESIDQDFARAEAWGAPLARTTILPRLVRRYAAENTSASLQACGRLLAAAPAGERGGLLRALDLGLPPGLSKQAPPGLLREISKGLGKDDPLALRLLTRLGDGSTRERSLQLASAATTPDAVRVALLQTLGELGDPALAAPLLKILERKESETIHLAALEAVQRFEEPAAAALLLQLYPSMSARLRTRTLETLLARKSWAKSLLQEIDAGRLPAKDVAVEQVRVVELHQDKNLDALVRKHWGSLRSATPEEKLAEVRRFNNDLRAGSGNPVVGRELYKKQCASCHKLFNEGENLGPDLTHANRKDRDFLLISLVDPAAVVRKEYLNQIVQTKDGRFLTGIVVEQTAASVTLTDAKNQRTTVARDRIEAIGVSPASLMPEGLIKDLSPQQLRDLFSYLQK